MKCRLLLIVCAGGDLVGAIVYVQRVCARAKLLPPAHDCAPTLCVVWAATIVGYVSQTREEVDA